MNSLFGNSSGPSYISGEKKGANQAKQSKRKIEKMGAVKKKGKIKKTEMDKTSLKQTGLENWAIRTQEEKKTPLGKKIDNGNTISRSA